MSKLIDRHDALKHEIIDGVKSLYIVCLLFFVNIIGIWWYRRYFVILHLLNAYAAHRYDYAL